MRAYDPATHAQMLYSENLWLRQLLTRMAQDLERLAGNRRETPRPVLARRARLVRKRLHEGYPEG